MFQVRKIYVGKCQIYEAILIIHTVDMLSAQYLHERGLSIEYDLTWQYLYKGGVLSHFLSKHSSFEIRIPKFIPKE